MEEEEETPPPPQKKKKKKKPNSNGYVFVKAIYWTNHVDHYYAFSFDFHQSVMTTAMMNT